MLPTFGNVAQTFHDTEDGDGFQAVVTAPDRDDAVALAGVELIPA